jgi:hypothetical protein
MNEHVYIFPFLHLGQEGKVNVYKMYQPRTTPPEVLIEAKRALGSTLISMLGNSRQFFSSRLHEDTLRVTAWKIESANTLGQYNGFLFAYQPETSSVEVSLGIPEDLLRELQEP